MTLSDERHGRVSTHGRPFDRAFYERVRQKAAAVDTPRARVRLPGRTGAVVRVYPGEIVDILLLEGPQIVHLFALNPRDPDERLWAQNTGITESVFLSPFVRLWSTMPRFRPMLTVLEDDVGERENSPNSGEGRHHFIIGGWQTPREWTEHGGPSDVPSAWERLGEALGKCGLPSSLLMDELCLFQRVAIDPISHDLTILPSQARAGDRVRLFVEYELLLVLALNPYREGGVSAAESGHSVREVDVVVYPSVASPLPWPYPGVPYPDLSLYLNADGVRSEIPTATPGMEQ